MTILFQDGVDAHGATPQQALARFDLIRARHPKTEMIAEAFRPNPTPGGAYFIPATAAEYQAQLQAYAHLDPVHVFDGPNYLDAALIQRIGGVEPALPPTALNARVNSWGDARLDWQRASAASVAVAKYRVEILDGMGAQVLRRYEVPGGQAHCFYPVDDSVADFGFPPAYLAWRVTEVAANGYESDPRPCPPAWRYRTTAGRRPWSAWPARRTRAATSPICRTWAIPAPPASRAASPASPPPRCVAPWRRRPACISRRSCR